ncbi:MAG: nucleoside deaminase [Bacilli bacterium]|nr:nucleoside deaminase [Bacilli bacterium]
MNIDSIEKELNKLINKAIKHDEVPVAALIIKDNKIISKSYNKVNKTNNILDHAEIISIIKAQKKLNNWRLNNCDLYVTLEPCSMCKEIIKKSRINNVYYFIKQNNNRTELDVNYKYLFKNDNFSNKLTNFFKNKR